MFGAFSSFLEDTAKQISSASEGLIQNISVTLDTTLGTAAQDDDKDKGSDVGDHQDLLSSHSVIHTLNGPAFALPPVALEKYAAEWTIVLHGLLEDENTFSVPLSQVFGDAESRQRLEAHQFAPCSSEDLEQLWTAALIEGASPHETLIHAVVNSPEAQKTRFEIVPRFVSEGSYWAALLTRVALLHRCSTLEQLLEVMEVLNREPRRDQGSSSSSSTIPEAHNETAPSTTGLRRKGFGRLDNVVLMQNIRDQVLAKRTVTSWIEQRLQAARSEIQSTLGSLQLLRNLVLKEEVSELADSVRESCKYRKGKVTSLLADLQNATSTVVGTPLEPDNGEVYLELVNVNEELHACIVDYAAMRQKVIEKQQHLQERELTEGAVTGALLVGGASPHFDASGSASSKNGALSSSTAMVGAQVNTASAGTPVGGSGSSGTDSSTGGFVKVSNPDADAEFTPDLPWDDDEE